MKKIIATVLVLMMLVSLVACGGNEANAPEAGVSFSVVVTDLEGAETTFEITSNKATVGEALVDEGLIEGHETEYGLYVDSVNGIAADWEKDQTYWAFYIDGEYALTGVDATEISADSVYSFVLTKGE